MINNQSGKPGSTTPSFSASYRPHKVVVGLGVVVHVSIVEVHLPGVVRIGRVGSRRPIVVRLHAGKSARKIRPLLLLQYQGFLAGPPVTEPR